MGRQPAAVAGLLATCALAAGAALSPQGSGRSDPLDRPAMAAPAAGTAFLCAITRAGDRLVAVGERGIVLLSDDNGRTWRQVATPVSVTLTRLQFVDARLGWAIGHAGVVLHTADGGETWTRQLDGREVAALVLRAAEADAGGPDADDAARAQLKDARRMAAEGADKPWLDVRFRDAANGWIVGAYGLILHTADGGRSWQSALARVDNPKGLHLYAIRDAEDGVYLAGEQGFLARAVQDGGHFARLASPYNGTWFALHAGRNEPLLLAGLRGHVELSSDHGASWHAAPAQAVPASFSSAVDLPDGRVLLVDQAGGLTESRDGGASLRSLRVPPGPPITDLAMAADGTLVATSFRGARRLTLDSSPAASPP